MMTRFRNVGTKHCFVGWIDIWRSWSEIRLSSLGSLESNSVFSSRSCNLAHIVSAHLSLCFIVFPFGGNVLFDFLEYESMALWNVAWILKIFSLFLGNGKNIAVKDKSRIIILFHYILMFNFHALMYYAL